MSDALPLLDYLQDFGNLFLIRRYFHCRRFQVLGHELWCMFTRGLFYHRPSVCLSKHTYSTVDIISVVVVAAEVACGRSCGEHYSNPHPNLTPDNLPIEDQIRSRRIESHQIAERLRGVAMSLEANLCRFVEGSGTSPQFTYIQVLKNPDGILRQRVNTTRYTLLSYHLVGNDWCCLIIYYFSGHFSVCLLVFSVFFF